MKRALLIAGGTIGGLGAVLSITPPQFGTSSGIAGGIKTSGTSASATPTPTQTQAVTPTQTPTSTTTKKAKPGATKKATTTPTKAASAGVSGTFTGAVSNTQFGPVQVQITVSNGKITDANFAAVDRRNGIAAVAFRFDRAGNVQ